DENEIAASSDEDAIHNSDGQNEDEHLKVTNLAVSDFILANVYGENVAHYRIYVGQVEGIQDSSLELKFMRKKAGTFVFPNVDDTAEVEENTIMKKLVVGSNRRGHYTFSNIEGISRISFFAYFTSESELL